MDYSFDADIKAKHLYELLLSGKKGQMMTLSAFSKLAKIFNSLKRTRIELLFKRVVKSGNMPLDSFFVAIEQLATTELSSGYEDVVNHALLNFNPDIFL